MLFINISAFFLFRPKKNVCWRKTIFFLNKDREYLIEWLYGLGVSEISPEPGDFFFLML